MINKLFKIYYSQVTINENGEPVNVSSFIDILGHIETKSNKTILQDEGNTNKYYLSIRITDSSSIAKINDQINDIDYLLFENKKYTVAELRKYQTHIEIFTQ